MFLILTIALIATANCKLSEIVQTAKGPVQGEISNTVVNSVQYSSFKGIPYAEPPLDYLRFKPPVEKRPWSSTLNVIVEGANCVQKDFVHRKVFTGSEDCLYLNVYTPQLEFSNIDGKLKPVMVWIHGGSFKAGYGNSSVYGPDFLIEEGVVVVTFNYRLGPLGFLSLNHENATGNAGLKDQNMVLRWVQENIAHFGGDPNSVTIFGQSAGGASVDFHVLSEMSKGLFHRSISMSASPLCPWSFHDSEDAEKQAFALGDKFGASKKRGKDEVLQVLYKTPVYELVQAAKKLGSKMNPPFKPTIERTDVAKDQEKFLTECSYNKYKTGNYTKLPHLTGHTKHETLLFLRKLESITEMANDASTFLKSLPSKISINWSYFNMSASELARSTVHASTSTIKEIVKKTSDLFFIVGIDMKQKLLQKSNSHPVYYYRLSFDTEKSVHKLLYNIPFNGVGHSDDLAYLFHMSVIDLSFDPNDLAFITRKRIVRMWTNFAKYSNPTPYGKKDELLQGITWPESGKSGQHLEIREDLSIRKRSTSAVVKFYELFSDLALSKQTGCKWNLFSG